MFQNPLNTVSTPAVEKALSGRLGGAGARPARDGRSRSYRGDAAPTKLVKEPLQKPSASDRDIISSGTDWRAQVGGNEAAERYGKTTRRAVFLAEMERVVPWPALCGLIDPVYPKPGHGRPPIGVERMLRIYFLHQWFNLSDPAVGEALCDSAAMRDFVGIDLGREPVPDETTVCRFRHLLEQQDLGRRLFDEVHRYLADKGLKIATGTIVDATIIHAPSSTKNAEKARDPEMHQTKKGNQWYFGMKAHLGVESHSKLIHAVVATPANAAYSTVLPDLLHVKETRVWGDQAYRGQRAVIRRQAPKAQDFTNRRYRHRGVVDEVERTKNRTKSKVRARVEHSIGIIKRVFGFAKVRYRGLKKNTHRLLVTCSLANLFMARRHLLRCARA
jgi:IS5 family transposase